MPNPTRNAWMPLAAWLRARGAIVILLPRRYVSETETTNDRTTTHGYPSQIPHTRAAAASKVAHAGTRPQIRGLKASR